MPLSSMLFRASLVPARSTLVLPFLCPHLAFTPHRTYALSSVSDLFTNGSVDDTKRVPDHNADIFKKLYNEMAQGLDADNVQQTLKCWSALRERDLQHHLSPTHLARISQLLADQALPQPGQALPPSSSMKKLEEIALTTAVSRSPALLEACMNLYLSVQDTEAITNLYTRFKGMLGDQENFPDPNNTPQIDLDTLSMVAQRVSGSYHASRINIQLIALAAYALRDEFHAAVKATIGGFRLHDYTAKTFLATLDRPLGDKLNVWLRRLDIVRQLSNPVSHSIHIRQLGESQNRSALASQYNHIIDGILGPDPYIAVDVSKQDGKRFIAMTDRIWTAFLSAFLACGARERAEILWADYTRCGMKHSASMWTCLIDSFAQLRQCESAYQTFVRMQKAGIEPDSLSYRALLSALLEARRFKDADEYFKQFQETIESQTEASRVISLYNTYINGLVKSGRASEATALFDALVDSARNNGPKGPRPDVVTFNTMIWYFSRESSLKAVSSLVKTMAELGIAADVVTYSIMLSALLKAKSKDAVSKVFALMARQGLEANSVTYGSMVVEVLKARTAPSLYAAYDVLNEMERRGGSPAGHVKVYETFLLEYWKMPFTYPAAQVTQDILTRLRKRKIRFTGGLCHAVMRSALHDQYPKEGVELAWKMYGKMVNQNFVITVKTYETLLEGMIRKQKVEYALKLCSDMAAAGLKMSVPLSAMFKRVEQMRRRMQPTY